MRKSNVASTSLPIDDALLARIEQQAWFHRYPRGWPSMLFLITLLLTAASVFAIERADRKARSAELDRNATEIASGLQRRASETVAMLRAASALYSFRKITPIEFEQFAADLYTRGQYRGQFRGALGIGWSPLITAAGVPTLETSVRSGGNAGFRVWPRPTVAQQPIAPVIDVVPHATITSAAVGFDMFSEPVRAAAIKRALVLQQPVASGRLHLIVADQHGPVVGFLIYVPVFRDYVDHTRATAVVYSPVRVEAFLESAAELYTSRGVEIAIYDGDPSAGALMTTKPLRAAAGLSIDRRITIANHEWTLRVGTEQAQWLSGLSRVTLVFGVMLGLLVMYVGRVITRGAVEDRLVLEALHRQTIIRTQLTRELNHRVKNTLANVLSIVSLTRRRASGLDEFTESLSARLRALSATHDLLAQSDWADAAISDIVRSELAPYLEGNEGQIFASGPAINLAPNDALSLGLAIHELATNAAKYGALSTPDGHVSVTWHKATDEVAELDWRESHGPEVEMPTRRGFGRDLIEKIVAQELRAQITLEFKPGGVECRLQVPIRRAAAFEIRSKRPATTE